MNDDLDIIDHPEAADLMKSQSAPPAQITRSSTSVTILFKVPQESIANIELTF